MDLYEFAPVGYLTLDSTRRITEANLNAARMLQIEEQDPIGEGLADFVSSTCRDILLRQFQEAEKTGHQTQCDVEFCTPEQPCFFARVQILPVLRNPALEEVAFRVTISDITQQKRLEGELRESNEMLEVRVAERTALLEKRSRQLIRLSEKLVETEQRERKRLAGILHDDLQQILVAIKHRLHILSSKTGSETVAIAQETKSLVGEAIQIARNLSVELSPPVLHWGSLRELIEWVASWFEEKYDFRVSLDLPDRLPTTSESFRGLVFQVLRELLFNANKHSGLLEARVRVACEGGHLRISVEDSGRGFDPASLEEKQEDPTGFGVFNIKERLEAVGGALEVDSAPGAGTKFRVSLPLGEGETELVHDAEALNAEELPVVLRPSEVGEDQIRLLVVDDHKIVREGLITMLGRQADMAIVGEATDGLEAVRMAGQLQPDVIVMDVSMPNMDGVEATRQIKRQWPGIAVVALSVHNHEDLGQALSLAGARAFLRKDLPSEELFEAIRAALPGRRITGFCKPPTTPARG